MVAKKFIAGSALLGALFSYSNADAKPCVPDGKYTVQVEAVEKSEQRKTTYRRGGPLASALKKLSEEQGCRGNDQIRFLLRGNSRFLGEWQKENNLTAEQTLGEKYDLTIADGKITSLSQANNPPYFVGRPEQKLSSMGDLELTLTAEDKDKDDLYLKAGSSGPGGQPLELKYDVLESGPGSLKARFSSASLLPGDYLLTVEVHDGKGGKDTLKVPVKVKASPLPEHQEPAPLPVQEEKLEEKVKPITINLVAGKSASAYAANKVLTDFDGNALVYALIGFQKDLPKGFSLAVNLGYRYDGQDTSSSSLSPPTATKEALPENAEMYKSTEERSASHTIDRHHDFVVGVEALKQIVDKYLQAGFGVEGIFNGRKTVATQLKKITLQDSRGNIIGEPSVFESHHVDRQGAAVRPYAVIESCLDWKTNGIKMGACAGAEFGAEFGAGIVRPIAGVRSAYRINF